MDGLLIDSEPLWNRAEIDALQKVGVELTPELVIQSRGLRTDEKIRYWFQLYPWDETQHSQESVTNDLIDAMVTQLSTGNLAQPGVQQVVSHVEAHGVPMAIASSSPQRIIDAAMEQLDISHKLHVIYSAQYDTYGIPHPAVYLSTAEKLGIAPEYCLAFEDSVNGVLSAKSAKMKCIAVPESGKESDRRFGIADHIMTSLELFEPSLFDTL